MIDKLILNLIVYICMVSSISLIILGTSLAICVLIRVFTGVDLIGDYIRPSFGN